MNSYKPLIFLPAVILVIIAGSLLNTRYFYIPTLSAYYLFIISTAGMGIITGCMLVKKYISNINLSWNLFFMAIWCLYIVIQTYLTGNNSAMQIYYLSILLFFMCITLFFNHPRFSFLLLYKLIFALSCIEALICMLQYAGWCGSISPYFKVSGTYTNPNVTAMFMAMMSSVIPVLYGQSGKKLKRLILSGTGMIIIALFLLKCRSAFIGGAMAISIFFALKYRVFHWLADQRNRKSVLIMAFLGLGLAASVANVIYQAKKDSADGRKFIWKVSSAMIAEKPFVGYGYGSFEREYNLYQSAYVATGKASAAELENARHVFMAYNEFLQNLLEGGLPGLLLFLLVIISLLYNPLGKATILNSVQNNKVWQNHDNERSALSADYLRVAYAGAIAFCIMGIFNFTLPAIPVMLMFLLYAAVINYFTAKRTWAFAKTGCICLGIILLLTGIVLAYTQIKTTAAHRQNKLAANFLKDRKYQEAITILTPLSADLSDSDSYWRNYAQALVLVQDYREALETIEKAKQLSANPELYLLAGNCYLRLKQYPQAVQEYQQASYLEPTRFKPRYYLMNSALKAGDIPKALHTAQEIIDLRPKIPSDKVTYYKNAAKKLLKKYDVPPVKNQFLYER